MTPSLTNAVDAVRVLIADGVPPEKAAEVVGLAMRTDLPPVVTFDEACAFLRITRERLHAEIAAGNLKARKVTREIIVIYRRNLLRWLGESTL
jgi:hypothetical protein